MPSVKTIKFNATGVATSALEQAVIQFPDFLNLRVQLEPLDSRIVYFS